MTQTSTPAPSTFAVMAESAEQAVPCADLPLEQRVEAVLMVADRPMSEGRIAELLGIIDAAPVRRRRKKAETTEGEATPAAEEAPVEETPQQKRAAAQVREAIDALNTRYQADARTFRIESVAGGRQVMTLPAFGPIVARHPNRTGRAVLPKADHLGGGCGIWENPLTLDIGHKDIRVA
jgi:chromosome segregation and condensation protein ScpB